MEFSRTGLQLNCTGAFSLQRRERTVNRSVGEEHTIVGDGFHGKR
jgi:hypothetical protein